MFDWVQYHHLAKELLGMIHEPVGEEAKQRSAISRAYYAAFNIAAAYVIASEGDNALPAGVAQHEAVQRHFSVRKDMVSRKIADDLAYLRAERNKADYKINTRISPAAPKEAVRRAGDVIRQIDALTRRL
jgi:uncharacterized protein (UPF0332 family)